MIEKLISQSPWHDAVHLPQAHGTVRRVKIMVQDDPVKISVEHHSICECWAIKTEWGMEWCECLQFKIMIMHLLWTHAARIEWGEKVKNVTRIGELNGNDSIRDKKTSWHEFTFLFNCNYSARWMLCRKKKSCFRPTENMNRNEWFTICHLIHQQNPSDKWMCMRLFVP